MTAIPTPLLGVTVEERDGSDYTTEWWGALWVGGSQAFEFELPMSYYDTQDRAYEDACDHVAEFFGRLHGKMVGDA